VNPDAREGLEVSDCGKTSAMLLI